MTFLQLPFEYVCFYLANFYNSVFLSTSHCGSAFHLFNLIFSQYFYTHEMFKSFACIFLYLLP